MAMPETPNGKTFGEKLQSVPRQVLYLLLVLCATVPAFVSFPVPNKALKSTEDIYSRLAGVPNGSTVLIQTDWTKSTRGESMGQFEALLRILMRKEVKFVFYSVADPQAPQVARDAIRRVTKEVADAGGKKYEKWDDWLDLGYFPNAEGFNQSIAIDFRTALAGRTDNPGHGQPQTDIFKSPVLQNITRIQDFPLMVIVTASSSLNILIERVSDKVDLVAMVTGVMVPETQVYYASGQLKGMSGGLKGVYDLENLMKDGFPGQKTAGKGTAYYPTLHVVLTLLMLAVIAGNVGMWMARRSQR